MVPFKASNRNPRLSSQHSHLRSPPFLIQLYIGCNYQITNNLSLGFKTVAVVVCNVAAVGNFVICLV